MVTGRQLQYLTLRVHVVLNDHVQLVHLDLVVGLAEHDLAAVKNGAEGERAGDLDRVQVLERLERPDARRPIQRRRHEQVREVVHFVQLGDVLVMATVGMD